MARRRDLGEREPETVREARCRWHYERTAGRDPGPYPDPETLTLAVLTEQARCECELCGPLTDAVDPRDALA